MQETVTKSKYQQTEIGWIPEDAALSLPKGWEVKRIEDICDVKGGGTPKTNVSEFWNGIINWFTPTEVGYQKYLKESKRKITELGFENSSTHLLPKDTILLTSRAGIGDLGILMVESTTNQGFQSLICKPDINNEFVYYLMQVKKDALLEKASGSTFLEISPNSLRAIKIGVPSKSEQTAIAQVLSDTDAWIESLEKLIAKKKAIKQGTMQELLTGRIRLRSPSGKTFEGEWKVKHIYEIADCLDNLRVPLNSSQREKMKGNIPYCGANGILDYINEYLIGDNIILLAEDGGYFDEYETRPIAYQMKGKCWVNNHAHILKAKSNFDQTFLFYSIVHKNILDFISGGTRAKLNKKQLLKISINSPETIEEQTAIANALSAMDQEIEALENKLEKARQLKTGMMQELLTGKIRLPLDTALREPGSVSASRTAGLGQNRRLSFDSGHEQNRGLRHSKPGINGTRSPDK